MSRRLPYFKFDAAKWLSRASKVQFLSHEQKGIFIDLCALIWEENGRVKNDEFLARRLTCVESVLTSVIGLFNKLGILVEQNGFLSVKFLDEQLKECESISKMRRKAGEKSAQKRWKKEGADNKCQQIREEKRREEKNKETLPHSSEGEKKAPQPENQGLEIQGTDGYPRTVEDVVRIAAEGGKRMSQDDAEAYLLTRQKVDWVDALGRQVKPGNVKYDVKAWCLNNHNAAAERQAKGRPENVMAQAPSDDEYRGWNK